MYSQKRGKKVGNFSRERITVRSSVRPKGQLLGLGWTSFGQNLAEMQASFRSLTSQKNECKM